MTYTYMFSGRVHPERAYVTLSPIRCTIETRMADSVLLLNAHIKIDNAQVLVVATTEERVDNLETVRNSVESAVRGAVDAFSFVEGRGYDVEITSVIDSTGEQWTVFGVEVGVLQASKRDRPVTYGQLYALMTDPKQIRDEPASFRLMQLRIALGDLREAVRSPNLSAFFCFRAIECIRQCYVDFANEDENAARRDSWERMRSELCIGRSWFSPIERFALGERHGKIEPMSGDERVDVLLRTWSVVDRFIQSARNNFDPLSEDVLQ